MKAVPALAALGAYALVACFYFWQPLSKGLALVPAVHFYDVYPWTLHRPADLPDSRNFLLGDVSALIYPYLAYNLERWRSGELALWNPYTWGGMPYVANGQSGFLDPTIVLAAILPLPVEHVPLFLVIVRLTLCGFFTFLWLRRLTNHFWAALLGGFVVLTAQFVVAWAIWPVTAVLLWLPLVLWAIERVITGGVYSLLVLSGAVALVWLPGHIETSFQIIAFSTIYGTLRLWCSGTNVRLSIRESCSIYQYIEHASRGLRTLIGGIVCGTLLVAPLLFPMAEYILQSSASEVGRSYLGQTPVRDSIAFGLLGNWEHLRLYVPTLKALTSPYAFGSPALGHYELPFTNYNEQLGYVSIVATITLFLSLRWLLTDVRAKILLALGLLSVGVAFEAPVLHLVNFLPIMRMANNHRVHYFLVFMIAGCAALAFAKRPLARWGWMVGAGLCLLVIADGSVWISKHYPSIQPEYVYPVTAEIVRLQALQGDGRVISRDGYFPPNIGMLYGLADPRGYEVLRPRRYELFASAYLENRQDYFLLLQEPDRARAFLDLTATRAILDQEYPGGVRPWSTALPRAYLVPHAQFVPDAPSALALLQSGFDYTRGVILESSGLGVKPLPGLEVKPLKAEVLVRGPERVEVRANATQDAWLVLLDSFYPGWKASVDGREVPIYPANIAFRAVQVPEGEHTVTFIYDPWTFKLGLAVSALTALYLFRKIVADS